MTGHQTEAQKEGLRRARAVRTRGKHERMATELREAGYIVTAPPEAPGELRFQLEVHFEDTGWTDVGATLSGGELDYARGKLEGLRLGRAMPLVEHETYRFRRVVVQPDGE